MPLLAYVPCSLPTDRPQTNCMRADRAGRLIQSVSPIVVLCYLEGGVARPEGCLRSATWPRHVPMGEREQRGKEGRKLILSKTETQQCAFRNSSHTRLCCSSYFLSKGPIIYYRGTHTFIQSSCAKSLAWYGSWLARQQSEMHAMRIRSHYMR